VRAKYHTITRKLDDAIATRSSAEAVADATEALEKKTVDYTSALAQLQAIINHEMLLAIGKLLPLAKHGGTVLPKLERAFAVHNAEHRAKPREERKPYSAITAIALLTDECTGVSTAMQGVARTNVLRHARPTEMPLYEWSISFEKPLRELKLTGYVQKPDDDAELYKNVFSAQLTQNEVNTLYGRGFTTIDEGVFEQQDLEDAVNKHREIFSGFRPDKRCKEHITIVSETYDQPPLYAQTSTVARTKRAAPKDDWSWDSSHHNKRKSSHHSALMSTILKHWQMCTHPSCIHDKSNESHTNDVCPRQSSSQRHFRGKGKGKGKDKGKGKGKGKSKGKDKGKGKAKGGKGKGKGKPDHRGKGRGSPYKGNGKGRGNERVPAVPWVQGTPFTGKCFFCKKVGHRKEECKARIALESHPVYLAKTATYSDLEKESLVLLFDATGDAETCTVCLNPECKGPEYCNLDDIHVDMENIANRFITDGLQALALQMKATASSGIQSPSLPQTWPQEPQHWPSQPPEQWGTQWHDHYYTHPEWTEPSQFSYTHNTQYDDYPQEQVYWAQEAAPNYYQVDSWDNRDPTNDGWTDENYCHPPETLETQSVFAVEHEEERPSSESEGSERHYDPAEGW
jgi:hypothetical protein